MTPKSEPRTAIYPGSFNPFTRGHQDIATRALGLCDRLVIAVGVNVNKEDADTERRVAEIARLFEGDDRVSVESYTCLTGEYARKAGADFMVRGVRNVSDYEAELQLADANRQLFGIETVLLPARPELAWISSTAVRELRHFGADVSDLMPG